MCLHWDEIQEHLEVVIFMEKIVCFLKRHYILFLEENELGRGMTRSPCLQWEDRRLESLCINNSWHSVLLLHKSEQGRGLANNWYLVQYLKQYYLQLLSSVSWKMLNGWLTSHLLFFRKVRRCFIYSCENSEIAHTSLNERMASQCDYKSTLISIQKHINVAARYNKLLVFLFLFYLFIVSLWGSFNMFNWYRKHHHRIHYTKPILSWYLLKMD